MQRSSSSRSPSPASATSSPLSLSPLRSPMETGSHAEWLEETLLADMGPDEKWEVAVAKAPKCPKRTSAPSQPPSEVPFTQEDPAVASTSGVTIGVPTPDPPTSVRGVKRSSAGEEGAVVEAILDFEGSRGETEGRQGRPRTNEPWRSCTNGCCKAITQQIHHRRMIGRPDDSTFLLPPPSGS